MEFDPRQFPMGTLSNGFVIWVKEFELPLFKASNRTPCRYNICFACFDFGLSQQDFGMMVVHSCYLWTIMLLIVVTHDSKYWILYGGEI